MLDFAPDSTGYNLFIFVIGHPHKICWKIQDVHLLCRFDCDGSIWSPNTVGISRLFRDQKDGKVMKQANPILEHELLESIAEAYSVDLLNQQGKLCDFGRVKILVHSYLCFSYGVLSCVIVSWMMNVFENVNGNKQLIQYIFIYVTNGGYLV